MASEQVDRTEAALQEARDAFEKFARPMPKDDITESTAISAANASAATLTRIKDCSALNPDGTITLRDPALLDTLANITCALGQVATVAPCNGTAETATEPAEGQQTPSQEAAPENVANMTSASEAEGGSDYWEANEKDDEEVARFLRQAHAHTSSGRS